MSPVRALAAAQVAVDDTRALAVPEFCTLSLVYVVSPGIRPVTASPPLLADWPSARLMVPAVTGAAVVVFESVQSAVELKTAKLTPVIPTKATPASATRVAREPLRAFIGSPCGGWDGGLLGTVRGKG